MSCLFIYLSICLSVCLYVCLLVCLYVYLSYYHLWLLSLFVKFTSWAFFFSYSILVYSFACLLAFLFDCHNIVRERCLVSVITIINFASLKRDLLNFLFCFHTCVFLFVCLFVCLFVDFISNSISSIPLLGDWTARRPRLSGTNGGLQVLPLHCLSNLL